MHPKRQRQVARRRKLAQVSAEANARSKTKPGASHVRHPMYLAPPGRRIMRRGEQAFDKEMSRSRRGLRQLVFGK